MFSTSRGHKKTIFKHQKKREVSHKFRLPKMVGGLVFTPSLLVALLVVWLLLTAAAAAEERRETLPDDCGTSVRRPWRDLSCHEQRQFLRTLSALKENGLYDEFVMVHWSSRLHSHDIPDFLPWHRWFLWVFEKELQRESGTCMVRGRFTGAAFFRS